MNMDFGANKTPLEVVKEGEFRGTYFRDIYSDFYTGYKWYRKIWKEFDDLKYFDKQCYCSNYYEISVNKYDVKFETSLSFWGNKDWIKSIDPYGWFQRYFWSWLGRRSLDEKRQIALWNGIVSRCRGKFFKAIKDANGRLFYFTCN